VVKSPYNGVQRLNHLQSWIKTKLASIGDLHIVDVAMEGTVLASHSALVLGELAAAVKLFFLTYDPLFLPLQIPPMTLKKFASGKGTSKKQEMLLQIYKRWGMEFSDDNAADAYALARLASGKFIDDVEKNIIQQVKDAKYRDVIQ
jgi:Holliday junction resolvasome RuvABC endonuclease subunit